MDCPKGPSENQLAFASLRRRAALFRWNLAQRREIRGLKLNPIPRMVADWIVDKISESGCPSIRIRSKTEFGRLFGGKERHQIAAAFNELEERLMIKTWEDGRAIVLLWNTASRTWKLNPVIGADVIQKAEAGIRREAFEEETYLPGFRDAQKEFEQELSQAALSAEADEVRPDEADLQPGVQAPVRAKAGDEPPVWPDCPLPPTGGSSPGSGRKAGDEPPVRAHEPGGEHPVRPPLNRLNGTASTAFNVERSKEIFGGLKPLFVAGWMSMGFSEPEAKANAAREMASSGGHWRNISRWWTDLLERAVRELQQGIQERRTTIEKNPPAALTDLLNRWGGNGFKQWMRDKPYEKDKFPIHQPDSELPARP